MKHYLKQWFPDSFKNRTRSMRRGLMQKRVQVRVLTGGERVMPSFLLIGAMKAGTTSLFRYLCKHPQVGSPITKEIDYFNFNWSRPVSWYAAHFPRAADLPLGALTGEASPGYLFHPRAALRAHECIPNARLIVLLRDPVARTLSQYFHQRRIDRETRPIEKALFSPEAHTSFDLPPEQEHSWLEALNGNPRPGTDAAALLAESPMHHAYITGSRYADHLPAWIDQFGRDRILVLRSEDLFSDPRSVFAKTLEFLDLEFIPQDEMPAHNVGKYPKSVGPEILARLSEEFKEPNRHLYRLLGEDFGWRV